MDSKPANRVRRFGCYPSAEKEPSAPSGSVGVLSIVNEAWALGLVIPEGNRGPDQAVPGGSCSTLSECTLTTRL
eukprot:scaffold2065_cov359-Prasinococcus_capsulatus_cf.AAC.10